MWVVFIISNVWFVCVISANHEMGILQFLCLVDETSFFNDIWEIQDLGVSNFYLLGIIISYIKVFFFFFKFFLWLILCGMLLLETEPSWGNLSTFLDGCLGIRIVHSLNGFKFFCRGILLLVYGGSLRSQKRNLDSFEVGKWFPCLCFVHACGVFDLFYLLKGETWIGFLVSVHLQL